MQYSINYKGITLENFDALSNDAANKYAVNRYTHFDTCENDTTGELVCTKTAESVNVCTS